MKEIRFTLVSDGGSNKRLIPILSWLLRKHCVDLAIQSEWADLRRLRKPPKKLSEKIKMSMELYPCDLLFIHRDAEKEPREKRVAEIQDALESVSVPLTVCVVPVKMQEAWLLFDESAIRRAAGNPNGKKPLNLPSINRIESLPDPNEILFNLLREASELTGRRLKRLKVGERAHRVSILVDDFTPLRELSAFKALEKDIKKSLKILIREPHDRP